MKKFLQSTTRDLWEVLLDVVAVNASYYLALLIRFYVNSEFRPTVSYLLGDWASFAPWYTVICIAVFMLWRLYGGMWRYTGINDMNRIIGANVCTAAIHVVGTLIFVRRIPSGEKEVDPCRAYSGTCDRLWRSGTQSGQPSGRRRLLSSCGNHRL